MKNILKSVIKQVAFWFLFFALSRIIFLIYYRKYLIGIDTTSILAVFIHAWKIDLSTVCYIMALPFLLLTIQSLHHKFWINNVILIYQSIIIFIYALITTAELGIYDEWQTKLSSKVIKYLSHPSEVYNSAATGTFYLLLFILLIQFSIGFLVFRRWFWHRIGTMTVKIYYSFSFFIVTLILIGLGLRGGWQQIPINQSDAYFSEHDILNLTAVNSGWNIMQSVQENIHALEKDPFVFYKPEEAKKITEDIIKAKKDTTVQVLKTKNPNIMLVILEGWSADLIESLGGEKGITPHFHELEKDGILFTNIYSSGTRSEQGMSNIFGAFPSHPLSIITRQPDKFCKLPSLSQTLREKGYHTFFMYGGDLEYGNIRGYIYFNKFERIIEESDFSRTIPRGKLGIHDEFIYPELLSNLNNEKTPFFAAYFTMSTHAPFDIPNYKEKIHWPKLEKEYVNAAFYADSCLNDFISKAKKTLWYKNTLFIIVSDHGHSSYKNRTEWSRDYQKIPLIFLGGAIKDEYRGTQIDKFGSQVDIASTLLHQMDIKSDKFIWSKNLLNPYCPDFSYTEFEVGFNWRCTVGDFVYDHHLKKFPDENLPAAKKDSIEKVGKAYLQELFRVYFEY
jgi:phosphoglycerol transferase MdoB-like AlkP superfamily enzyme